MYEPSRKKPIPRKQFAQRMVAHLLAASALALLSLFFGMLGYVYFEHLSWLDAFLNSTMLLGGMGPVNPPQTDSGKLFAGLYALYSGLVFIVTAGMIFAPVVHRVMHKLHWDDEA
jgi:hypothetical protein